MKITQSKAKDLIATISVEVVAKDYNDKVDKVLKDYRKTACFIIVHTSIVPILARLLYERTNLQNFIILLNYTIKYHSFKSTKP